MLKWSCHNMEHLVVLKEQNLSWTDANTTCQRMGYNLLSFRDKEMWANIRMQISLHVPDNLYPPLLLYLDNTKAAMVSIDTAY